MFAALMLPLILVGVVAASAVWGLLWTLVLAMAALQRRIESRSSEVEPRPLEKYRPGHDEYERAVVQQHRRQQLRRVK